MDRVINRFVHCRVQPPSALKLYNSTSKQTFESTIRTAIGQSERYILRPWGMSMDQSRYLKAAQDLINGRQVQRTSHSHLAFKNFLDDDGVWVTAIEQNPTKSSEWAVLSREGHTVIQFGDTTSTWQYL